MRNEKKYDQVLGITEDNEIVILNYTFESTLNGELFCGATGSILVPVTQAYIDERNDIDILKENYSYLWQEAVKDGNTELSLEDYLESLVESEVHYGNCYFLGHDTSDIHLVTKEDEEQISEFFDYDIETYECIGGGRCISPDIRWKKVLRPDLLAEALKFEAIAKNK